MEYNPHIEKLALQMGFHKTDYETCDFCDKPRDGMFIRSSVDEFDDDWYCICGFCVAMISAQHPFLVDPIKLGTKISELQSRLPVKLPF